MELKLNWAFFITNESEIYCVMDNRSNILIRLEYNPKIKAWISIILNEPHVIFINEEEITYAKYHAEKILKDKLDTLILQFYK